MLIKFESKSNRVKGISFHPKRPWILASLHNGAVQLWDYRMGTLIEKFEEHEGPVRGVAFHPTQPLFVSGGDDYKIKVWNYKQRRCLFTLNGHLDYVRTVFFHHEYPWILSASDDQTVRIWNWQSRQCISVLTGHNHYVMCAQFHPKEDLVVSASLDQTVRVWDISGLRKKNTSAPPRNTFGHDDHRSVPRLGGVPGGLHGQPGDMFGNADVLVKYVLEGHDRGVNWATFHPNLPLIVSGADDRQVKLWRMSETKAWEVDTCRGHFNNVSCVIFHPRQEMILSNSEDKSLRLWDMGKRSAIQSFRREHDRFWILQAHPELNLFAAGHDSGLMVFKLERERPAYAVHQNLLFYVKDKQVRMFNFDNSTDLAVATIQKPQGLNTQHRTMSYNPAEHAIILTSNVEGGIHEIYSLPREAVVPGLTVPDLSNSSRRGVGGSAVFVARNRYAVLNKATQQLSLRNLNNESSKTVSLTGGVNEIFYAATGTVYMTTATSVQLYDLQNQVQIAEVQAPLVKYIYVSNDGNLIALVGKHVIVIVNKKFEQLAMIHESIRIKSGTWDDTGIFIFSTLNHIKYALPNGDKGIIRTLDQPIYITRSFGTNLFCIDRDGKNRIITIDPTEFRFKMALVSEKYDEVMHIIRNSNLVGQSIIAYLRNKGFPEVALQFVKENKTRFDLALECGNLEVAMETAKAMEEENCWSQLAHVALQQGNHQTFEAALQRIKNFDKLSFLYVLTGNTEKLKKMMKIAELRGDSMSRFHNALFLGNVEEQVAVLKEAGQYLLAYVHAKRHGLEEEAHAVLQMSQKDPEQAANIRVGGALLVPPRVIGRFQESNWPMQPINRNVFASFAQSKHPESARIKELSTANGHVTESSGAWEEEELLIPEQPKPAQVELSASAAVGVDGAWGADDDDLMKDLPVASLTVSATSPGNGGTGGFVVPTPGPNPIDHWCRTSQIPADHIAAGSFESAMQLLHRQIGAAHFAPLKEHFMEIYQCSKVTVISASGSHALSVPLHRNGKETDERQRAPMLPYTFQILTNTLQLAYQLTTAGKFPDALATFKKLLQASIFTVVQNEEQAAEIERMVETAREYIVGLQVELARRELPAENPGSSKRGVELAAYFTHCNLQAVHLVLSLRSAMALAFKLKCYRTSAVLIRRLLELGAPPQLAEQARKLQGVVEANPIEEVALEYDPLTPFVLCAASHTPIYRGNPVMGCSFCQASYQPKFKARVCVVCEVGAVGGTGSGLRRLEMSGRGG